MRDISTICAGIVTYNPKLDLLEENIHALLPQVDMVFIVDNGSDNVSNIEELVNTPKMLLVKNQVNMGIAKALNQICEKASLHGYQWVLTMDQDSVCHSDMVIQLSVYTDNPLNGIIAPRVEFKDDDTLILSTKDSDKETVEVYACITSGSLTRLSAWKELGGFDEWLFIDRVDNEFCAHMIEHGYHILRINKAVLYQKAGEMRYKRVPFLGTVLLPYYDERRNYYICRNTVYFFRKYPHQKHLAHQVSAFVYSLFIKLIFESKRWTTIRSSIKGLSHGFKKRIER